MKQKIKLYICFVTVCLFFSGIASAGNKAGEEINWQVISSGGCQEGTSADFILSGTVGQTAVGMGSSPAYGLSHGYWQDFGGSSGPCDCEPGEMNGDAVVNIFDVTGTISFLYLGGAAPIPYEICSGDMNADCTVNIFDVTGTISFLYLGGAAPVTCEEWLTACGPPLHK
jgi:hypothetical protein